MDLHKRILTAGCAAEIHHGDCQCRNADCRCARCGRYEQRWRYQNHHGDSALCRSCANAELVRDMQRHAALTLPGG